MEKDKARTEEISNALKKVQAEKLEMGKQRKSEAEANLATLEKIRSEKAELQRQNREASDRIQAASGVIKHGKELRAGLHNSLRMVNVKALAALVVVKNLQQDYDLLYGRAEVILSVAHQLEDRAIQYEEYIKKGQEWERDTRQKIEEDRQFYIREIGKAQAAYQPLKTCVGVRLHSCEVRPVSAGLLRYKSWKMKLRVQATLPNMMTTTKNQHCRHCPQLRIHSQTQRHRTQ